MPEPGPDLKRFLTAFDPPLRALALWLREWVWAQYPKANEILYDNYNALVIGWSITGKPNQSFGSVICNRPNQLIHFGFYWGALLPDPEHRLHGAGKQYRYLIVRDKESFPSNYVTDLLRHAYAVALSKTPADMAIPEGKVITRAEVPVKRARTQPKRK